LKLKLKLKLKLNLKLKLKLEKMENGQEITYRNILIYEPFTLNPLP